VKINSTKKTLTPTPILGSRKQEKNDLMHDLLFFTSCGLTPLFLGYNSCIKEKKALVIKSKAFKQ
jgi:hypothetical protein